MTMNANTWDDETDLLVAGSGIAGCSAAIFARQRGLEVLVCEKTPVVGGTSATSGGFIWVPGTAQAKAAVAQFERQVAQDTSALQLLVGRELQAGEVEAAKGGALSAASASSQSGDPLMQVPASIASTALLDRPDVIAAERQLDAAQANVSAARKAVLPAVTLTAQAGQASTSLRDMFDRGSFAYTVAANIFFAIFDGGRRQTGIEIAESTQRAALAQYERAVQSAFRETADALVGVDTWRRQRAALDEQLRAAQDLSRLVDLKVQRGAANLLEQLEAQRNLFAAEQAAVQARQAELASRVAVWKALGR